MAIHRMPAAAPSTARPSSTNPNANTSTHETAKNSVVKRSRGSGLRSAGPCASRARPAREELPHAICLPLGARTAHGTAPAASPRPASIGTSRPSLQHDRAGGNRLDGLEVVRRDQHDAADVPEAGEALPQRRRRGVVQAGEGLVEQHQPRLVQQRALERQPLAHPAREPRHRVVAPRRQAGAIERGVDPALDVSDAVAAARRNAGSPPRSARDTGRGRGRAGRCAPAAPRRPHGAVLAVADLCRTTARAASS